MSEGLRETERYLCWNGSIQSVDSVSMDPRGDAWLYGYGFFETMGLRHGSLRFFEDHWERLSRTAEEMSVAIPFEREEVMAAVGSLAEKNGFANGVARLSLHPSGDRIDWMLRVFGGIPKPAGGLTVGFSRFPHPGPSPLSRWKHANYLLNLLAYREGKEAGWDETILCHDGEVVEGAFSNLWILRDGQLLTPPLSSGALPGVIRARILGGAGERGLPVRESVFQEDEISQADGVFLSNAGMGVREVVRLGSLTFPPHPEWIKSLDDTLEPE